jgi:hypothetical protein
MRHEKRRAETVSGEEPRIRYRYRTSVLAGSWRESRADALRDALKAHQALADPSAPEGIRWLVHGEIEEEGASELVARIQRH